MEIPDQPDRPICTACMSPLVWLWSPRKDWIAFVTEPTDDGPRLALHHCDRPASTLGRTKPDPDVATRSRKRMAEIRRAKGWGPNPLLAVAAGRPNPFTEEK